MKEKPILFSGPMVRAILEGRKSQTRRVVKPQPPNEDYTVADYCDWEQDIDASGIMSVKFSQPFDTNDQWGWWPRGYKKIRCPYGQPGDRLWVRETFLITSCGVPIYKADMVLDDTFKGMWKPSIYMPRWASRIELEVTGVRVERLNGITPKDAEAEGCGSDLTDIGAAYVYGQLWESINGHGSWEANPYVWVVEFRRVKP